MNAAFAAIKDMISVPWKKNLTKRPDPTPIVRPKPVSTGSGPGTEAEPIVIDDHEETVPEPERAQPEPITVFKTLGTDSTTETPLPKGYGASTKVVAPNGGIIFERHTTVDGVTGEYHAL